MLKNSIFYPNRNLIAADGVGHGEPGARRGGAPSADGQAAAAEGLEAGTVG
jgi:hypothetical protein